MKKKILSFLTLLCMVTALLPTNIITVSAYTGTKYGDLYYTVSDGEVTITDCDSLATTITIPAKISGKPVTSIGKDAFCNRTNLTSITIPDGVTSIGSGAFWHCSNLTSITIPSSVTSIGSYAFSYCSSLTSIDVDENNTNYCSIDENLFNKEKTELIQYAVGKNDTQYVIPSGVTNIGSYAFYSCNSLTCYRLTSITIPSGVTNIGSYAFYSCNSLTSITIPDGVTSIGEKAFYYTAFYNNSSNWDNDVLYLGKYLLCAKKSLSGKCTVKSGTICIAGEAFYECSSLTSITIPSGVTSIGDRAFASCDSLTSITIPSDVTSIGSRAFPYCSSLTSIDVDENNTNYCSIDGNLFNKEKTELIQYAVGKNDTQYAIPNGVTSIGDNAFYSCDSLTSITIPSGVTSIGDDAFYSCDSLTSITIPSGVTSIGDNAFCFCDSLTSITIPSGVTSIGDKTFFWCNSLTSITIPSGVTNIGSYAFYYCRRLTNLYYNGTENEWNNISIGSYNTSLTNATRTYFAYINISDKDGNKVIDTTQNIGETIDVSAITVPDACLLKLYTDKEMTEEYSLDTPISENLNLYYDITELDKVKISGVEKADIGQKNIIESIGIITTNTATDFIATIKYSDKLKLSAAMEKDFSISEQSSETVGGYTYLYLTCTYKNDGNMPKNTTLNPFDLVFDVSENAQPYDTLAIEFVNDETFLADSDGNTYDFVALGTAEIKVNPIPVKSITINGADEIDTATQYTAAISPENATNKDIEWSVDDETIATISQDGTLTPVKSGTVKITATAKDGSEVYGEKSVLIKVYAQITSLTAKVGENTVIWDKEFTPNEREYTIYVPKNTSSIKLTAQHGGKLQAGTLTFYSGRAKSVTLTGDETVLKMNYTYTGYTDSVYTVKIVKFEGTQTTVSEDRKTFTVNPINVSNGNVIVIALYDGDTLIDTQSAVYGCADVTFGISKAYTAAKVMVWENMSDIVPVCEAEIVK